ncbi:MAG: hypothetical protein AAF235_06415 [Planctomycetota bacterium]
MHTPPFPNRSRLALPSALIACLVAAAGSIEPADQQSTTAAVGVSARQPAGNPSPARGPAGEGSIPTDFRLPSRPIDGYLGFSATRVYTWREGRTIRLLLDGDARVAVGDVEVDADRAVVWLAPVNGAYHTFAYIINASTPEVDASLGIRASKLPLSGVIVPQGPIRMLADARIDRSPPVKMFGPLLTEAEVALGDAIRGRRPDLSGRGTPRFEPLTPIRPANPRTDIIVPEEFQDRQRRVELPRAAPPPPPEPLPDPVPEGGPAAGEVPAPSRRFRIEPDDKPDDKRAAVPEPEVIRQAPSRSTDDLRQPAQTDPANPNVADPPMIGRQREAQHQRTIPPREPRPARPAPREAEQPGAEDAPRMPAVEADTGAGEGLGTSVPPRSVPPRSAPPRSGEPRRPIFASGGVLYFSGADRVVVEDAGERNAVTLFGGVVVQYEGDAGAIELVAQRAVVFLRPGPLPDVLQGLSVEDVDGVYLEGGVRATDGDYTLRSERIYYDVRANRAIAVNAVFHTYDARRGFPLYMRADVVRQEAADEFQADEARFSNTAFFEPHVSIGARNLTIQSRPRPDGTTRSYVDARGVTVRAGNTPVLPLPRFRGDPERIAIRDIRFTDSNRQGFATETEWDPFALFDIERPDGLDATLDLDFDSDRGVGIGAQAEWNTGKSRGEMTAYLLPDDRGTDVGPTGEDIDLGGKTRSLFVLNNRTQVTPEWAMWTSVGYVSDESLTLDLFRRIGREGEDVTNRALLRRIDDQTMLTLEVQGQSNDFIANEHRLQSPGYAVDKLPEIELKSGRNAGQKMGIVMMEDTTGTIEVVLFAAAYQQFGHLLRDGIEGSVATPMYVLGRVDHSRGDPQIIVDKLVPIDGVPLERGKLLVALREGRINGSAARVIPEVRRLIDKHTPPPGEPQSGGRGDVLAEASVSVPTPFDLVVETEDAWVTLSPGPGARVRLAPDLAREITGLLGTNTLKLVGGVSVEVNKEKKKPWEQNRG